MKQKVKDYKKDPPVINITKATMDVLLKEDKPDQLIALYIFYCYTAAWQQTLQVRATTAYAAEGLGWSKDKLRKVKKRLVELGLVQDMQEWNKDGQFSKRYVRVYYFTVLGKNPCTVEPGAHKCLVTGSGKCLETGTKSHSRSPKRADGRQKRVVTKFDKLAADHLHDYILSHRKVTLNTAFWPNTFSLLRCTDKVSKERIKKVLKWYGHHIGEDYVPVAHCARTFREKFTRIEAAMERGKTKKKKSTEVLSEYRMGPDGEMGYYAPEE